MCTESQVRINRIHYFTKGICSLTTWREVVDLGLVAVEEVLLANRIVRVIYNFYVALVKFSLSHSQYFFISSDHDDSFS